MMNATGYQSLACDGDDARATREQLDAQLRGDGDGSGGGGGSGSGGSGVATVGGSTNIGGEDGANNTSKTNIQTRSDEKKQIDAAEDALRLVYMLDYEDLNAKTWGTTRASLKIAATVIRAIGNRQQAIDEETKRRPTQAQGNTPAGSWSSGPTRVNSPANSWARGSPFVRSPTSPPPISARLPAATGMSGTSITPIRLRQLMVMVKDPNENKKHASSTGDMIVKDFRCKQYKDTDQIVAGRRLNNSGDLQLTVTTVEGRERLEKSEA